QRRRRRELRAGVQETQTSWADCRRSHRSTAQDSGQSAQESGQPAVMTARPTAPSADGRRAGGPVAAGWARGRADSAHTSLDDLGHAQRPLAHDGEAPLVPVGVGDDVDGHGEVQLARDLERLEVLARRHALAMGLQPFLVERLQAEEHVAEAETLPVLEDLAVLDEHVAARLQVVLLLDPAPLDLLADAEAVLRVDEGDVVHQELVALGDARQVLGGAFGRSLPVAAPVEGPGAAERAVPRTAARELGRGAR